MAQSYVCDSCGYGSQSWMGKCPSCGEWNTFKTFNAGPSKNSKGRSHVGRAEFSKLKDIDSISESRHSTGIHEVDRVLGGGFVQGEVVLLAGEPGVGKSTLLLKLIESFACVYISGEESGRQIKQRADRLGAKLDDVIVSNEIHVQSILSGLKNVQEPFEVVVIDSIQTLYSDTADSSVGSVSQIKESAALLTEYAKNENKVLIIVGHVTKGGDIAGPKTLEHMVDCVLYLEGEQQSQFRILRAYKNRFGTTDEVGVFEMLESGLKEAVETSMLFEEPHALAPGRAVIAAMEGSRALFYEVQSLVVSSNMPMPRRVVNGIEFNRLQMILAILKKHAKINVDSMDVYVNVVGGLQIKNTSADLGIAASIVSAVTNKSIAMNTAFIGELGLLGEVRSPSGVQKLLKDTKRFGIDTMYSSKNISSIKLLASKL